MGRELRRFAAIAFLSAIVAVAPWPGLNKASVSARNKPTPTSEDEFASELSPGKSFLAHDLPFVWRDAAFQGPTEETFRVTGTVIDSETKQPIPGALVEVYGSATLADDKGNFTLQDIPRVTVLVQATKPGYFTQQQIQGMTGAAFRQPQVIHIGPDLGPVTVELVPEGIISGQITSAEGEPLDEIPVVLSSSMVAEGVRIWQPRGMKRSDDEGRFRIANLTPGNYYLSAGPSNNGLLARTLTARRPQGYPLTYYPSGQDMAEATPIVITPGKHVEVALSMIRQPLYQISGTVNGVNPGEAVSIQVQGSANFGAGASIDPRTGAFHTTLLPAGMYTIRATMHAGRTLGDADGAEMLTARTEISLNADAADVHLNLAPAQTISFNFRNDSTSGEEERPFGIPVWPMLFSADQGKERSVNQGIGIAGPPEKQKLVLRNVEPGRYEIQFHPNGAFYVASAIFGNEDLLRDDLVIAAQGNPQSIEVSVRDDGGTISAAVSPGGDRSVNTVFAVSQDFPKAIQRAFTNKDGVAVFSGVAPGHYKVFAVDNAADLEYRMPGVLDHFLLRASDVIVQAKQEASVRVEVLHREN